MTEQMDMVAINNGFLLIALGTILLHSAVQLGVTEQREKSERERMACYILSQTSNA